MGRRRLTIGGAVDECIKTTTEAWFREHGGYRTREEAFTEDVKHVTSSTQRSLGGELTVQVGIVTRRRHQEKLDFYRFKLEGSRGYVQSEKSVA